jgi:ubiquinol-cytochrome c reductase iron-sulfur subunit
LRPLEVDLSDLKVGQAITAMWRGKPIFIRHGTDEEIAEANAVQVDDLPDPIARNANLDDAAPANEGNRTTKGRKPRLA